MALNQIQIFLNIKKFSSLNIKLYNFGISKKREILVLIKTWKHRLHQLMI